MWFSKSNFLQKCLFITVLWYSQSPEVNMHFCIKWMSFWKSTVPKQSCVGGCQHSMFRSTGWWLSPLPSTRMDFCHSSFVTFILQSVVIRHFSTLVIPLTKFVGNDGRKFFFYFDTILFIPGCFVDASQSCIINVCLVTCYQPLPHWLK